MERWCQLLQTIAAATCIAAILPAGTVAQPLSMATDKIGTILNAGGAGMAGVISKHSKTKVVTTTFGGQDLYIAAMEKGEVDMGPLSSFGAWLQLTGKNPTGTKFKNMRLLRASRGGLRQSYVTAAASKLDSVAALKGKRLATEFLASPLLQFSTTASLKAAGMSLADIVPVRVSGVTDAVQALEAGRIDATWTAFGVPVVQEVNAKVPVAYLPMPDSPAAVEIFRKELFPGVRITTVPPISRLFLTKPTPMVDYDIYLVARADLPADKVRDVLTALWDHTDDLVKIHPILTTFSQDAATTELAILPYHAEAVAFYKSKGKWPDAMQKVQERNEALVK
jgi:TRAP transporter TAXI family solute receptor